MDDIETMKAKLDKKLERSRHAPKCPYHDRELVTEASSVLDVLSGETSFGAYCPEERCDYKTAVIIGKDLDEYTLGALNVK